MTTKTSRPKITVSDELKLYAIKHTWAFEEMVVDAKLTEANKLYSGRPVIAWSYLKQALAVEGKSARWLVLKAMRKELRRRGVPVPELPDRSFAVQQIEKFRILRSNPDAMEELLYEAKIKEAKLVCAKVGSMYSYLQSVYGSAQAVAAVLHDCIYLQRERRKSSCLQTE